MRLVPFLIAPDSTAEGKFYTEDLTGLTDETKIP